LPQFDKTFGTEEIRVGCSVEFAPDGFALFVLRRVEG